MFRLILASLICFSLLGCQHSIKSQKTAPHGTKAGEAHAVSTTPGAPTGTVPPKYTLPAK